MVLKPASSSSRAQRTKAGQAFGQGDVIVPVYYVFLYGNRQKKHDYEQPDVFQPGRYRHFEQLGRFARYDKGRGNRRYYEREYILQNGAYAQCRRHISGQCARQQIHCHRGDAVADYEYEQQQEKTLSER